MNEHEPSIRRDKCQDLARAVQDFPQIYAVPGYPISHLLGELGELGANITWSLNEKTAVEAAIGAALCGIPSLVVIKHNGLGIAADSLANGVVHGLAAPMIVIVGDDIDARASTSTVDSRQIAAAIGMVTLSPSLHEDVGSTVAAALAVSNITGAPTLVRVTGRLHDFCSARPAAARPAVEIWRGVQDTAHTHRLNKLARVDRANGLRSSATAALEHERFDRLRCAARHATLIIAVGDAEIPSGDGYCVFRVRTTTVSAELVWAIPHHDRALVVEEGAPVIETQLGGAHGRLTGHLPRVGRISTDIVERAIAGRSDPSSSSTERRTDPPSVYSALFDAIARHRTEGVFVATDVGSTIRLSYPPHTGADAALALGSSPSVCAGAARAGRSAIAVLGDFGLLHSGFSGLVELATEKLPVVTVVVENGIQEKTGGQPVPTVDFDHLLASSVGRVVTWIDPGWNADDIYERLSHEIAAREPIVVRFRRLT